MKELNPKYHQSSPVAIVSTSGPVEYTVEEGKLLRGFLARPKKIISNKPAVLVIHAAYGLGDHEKKIALRLSELGFTALAVDMYGMGILATNLSGFTLLMANSTLAQIRIRAGIDFLTGCGGVESSQIVIFGYCFG